MSGVCTKEHSENEVHSLSPFVQPNKIKTIRRESEMILCGSCVRGGGGHVKAEWDEN